MFYMNYGKTEKLWFVIMTMYRLTHYINIYLVEYVSDGPLSKISHKILHIRHILVDQWILFA